MFFERMHYCAVRYCCRMASDMALLFNSFKSYLENVQKIREDIESIVKKLEKSGREVVTMLQIVHNVNEKSRVLESCRECRNIIEKDVKPEFQKLEELLRLNTLTQYYEYHDNWKFISQRLSFAIALITYLETGELASYDNVAKLLGVECSREKGFHLDLEDYLMGVLQLPSELSRLAVNSVVYGDYSYPLHISQFVTKLNAGYQLLNFKNDSLRKRFDGLKYDVKKIEEVVYDLSIRGLVPKESRKGCS